MEINLTLLIITGAFVAAAAAYIGSMMVLKRMSLVGDALSHVALPGMAIALSFNFSPVLGAFITLTAAIIGIWYLEEHSDTYPDAIVGLFFTAALAIGVLITKEPDLLEALFGSIEKMNSAEAITTIAASAILLTVAFIMTPKIITSLISEELAKASGIKTKMVNFIYLFIVGAVVALGIRFVGTLLTGALVIIPAASAKNIAKGMNDYNLTAIIFGVFSAVIGIFIAKTSGILVGPVVVLVSVLLYIISYIYKSVRSI